MKPEPEKNKLLADYLEHALAYGEATVRGDYREANRNYRKMIPALHRLDRAAARKQLLPLLQHPVASVRCSSATHLLPYAEETAIETLELKVAEKVPWIAFDAAMVLSAWRKGTLKVP